MRLKPSAASARVANWWLERWCRPRAEQVKVLEAMRAHRLVRPVKHGARVPLPADDEEPSDTIEITDAG